jgi:hypothetical protein
MGNKYHTAEFSFSPRVSYPKGMNNIIIMREGERRAHISLKNICPTITIVISYTITFSLDARAHCSSALYHNNIMWPRLFIQIIHLYHEQESAHCTYILMAYIYSGRAANTERTFNQSAKSNIFAHMAEKLSYPLSAAVHVCESLFQKRINACAPAVITSAGAG